jgi:hypothetical protein
VAVLPVNHLHARLHQPGELTSSRREKRSEEA